MATTAGIGTRAGRAGAIIARASSTVKSPNVTSACRCGDSACGSVGDGEGTVSMEMMRVMIAMAMSSACTNRAQAITCSFGVVLVPATFAAIAGVGAGCQQ